MTNSFHLCNEFPKDILPIMQCDEEKRDGMQSGLLEKFVLGLCDTTERKEVESLMTRNPQIAEQIDSMKKAMKCYCTSCHGDNITSIIRSKITSFARPLCRPSSQEAKMLHLSSRTESPTGVTRFLNQLKDFFIPSNSSSESPKD